MDDIKLLRPDGLVSSPAFTHVAEIPTNATTIMIGGQNAVDAAGNLVGGDDIAEQARQVMNNLHTALAAADASVADLVSITVFFVDGVDVQAAYAVAAEMLATDGEPPLIVSAMVSGLAVPGALLELTATAALVR